MDLTYFTTLFLMLFLPKNETISQCFVTVAQSHVLQIKVWVNQTKT